MEGWKEGDGAVIVGIEEREWGGGGGEGGNEVRSFDLMFASRQIYKKMSKHLADDGNEQRKASLHA